LPARAPSDVPLYQALQLRTSEKENRDMADEWLYVMQQEDKIIDGHKIFENAINLLFEGKRDEAYAVLEQVLAKDVTDLVAKKYLSCGAAVHQSENGDLVMAYSSAVDLYREGKYEEAKTTLEKCYYHCDRLGAAIEAGSSSDRLQKTDLLPEEQKVSQKPMHEGESSPAKCLEELRQENECLTSAVHKVTDNSINMAYTTAVNLYLEGKHDEAKVTLEKCTLKDHNYDRLMVAIVAGIASGR